MLTLQLRKTLTSTVQQSFLVLAFSALVVSCQKGDTGPAGPTGPAGAAGAAGATGAQGPTGTANVIYSQWFTATPWAKDTVFDLYGFNYVKSTTDITQPILDSGTVIVFAKLLGYNTLIWPVGNIGQLPITVSYKFSPTGITYNDTWSAQVSLGKLKIRFVDDQNYYSSISTAHQFRYVIIPGGKKSTVASTAPGVQAGQGKSIDTDAMDDVRNNFSHMSYEEICDRLKIAQ